MVRDVDRYLKARTEALVKEIGVEAACAATGKSKATLGRYYSTHSEHASRFIPVDAVARLEVAGGQPYLSEALLVIVRGETPGARLDRLTAQDPDAEEIRVIRDALDAMEARIKRARSG